MNNDKKSYTHAFSLKKKKKKKYSTRKQTGSWRGQPDIRTAKIYISVLPEVRFLLSTL